MKCRVTHSTYQQGERVYREGDEVTLTPEEYAANPQIFDIIQEGPDVSCCPSPVVPMSETSHDDE